MVKKNSETVEDIMKKQLSILETTDKITKLEKEGLRDKKIIQELKEREKVSARALVLFERKMKFLKESIITDILKTCKNNENAKLINDDNIEYYKDLLDDVNNKLYELCNKLEEVALISQDDKAFILNKPQINNNQNDIQSRFDRLKTNFNQKIGSSVLRKPGRPKKEDQSIIADIGLGKKVEKFIDEETETRNRLNEIFYGTPTQKKTISTIPQTADSSFDFAEALNPNNSLQDIMQDIMQDLANDKPVVYNKENIDDHISRLSEIETNQLESGFISKPHLKTRNINQESQINDLRVKNGHKNGVLTVNHLFDDIKN